MNILKASAIAAVFVSYGSAIAQVAPGDDFVQSCTSPQAATFPYYAGTASCLAQRPFPQFGTVFLSAYFSPQRSQTVLLSSGGAQCTGLLNFVGNGTVTSAPVCSAPQPRYPFAQIGMQSWGCGMSQMHYGILTLGADNYPYQLEWRTNGSGPFLPYPDQGNGTASFSIGPLGSWATFRVRAAFNSEFVNAGQWGSWSYVDIASHCSPGDLQ